MAEKSQEPVKFADKRAKFCRISALKNYNPGPGCKVPRQKAARSWQPGRYAIGHRLCGTGEPCS